MNEFLMEEDIIIRQDNYIELSPVETFIPVAYFLIFILITGLVYHVFPAKKDKSSVLPLGIIGGLTFFLFKIYILSSIDGFDLILKKTTVFPFNFLSILGIYFGITLGFIYSSKSRSWHFQKEEKPLFKIKTIFLKFLAFIILGYGLMNFYEGFKIKYDYAKNYPIKTEPIYIDDEPIDINNEPIDINNEPVYIDDEKDEYIPNRNYNYSPQTQEKNKDLNNKEKNDNKKQNKTFEPILNQDFDYTPKSQENRKDFTPETQKLKELM